MHARTYITTPIYYVNDRPHIGHCYTTLVADCAARFARAGTGDWAPGTGKDPGNSNASADAQSPVPSACSTFFLTGTDEHADKVVTSALSHNMTAIQWADKNADEFRMAFAFIHASNDDFIRTTQDRHKHKVTEYVSAMIKAGSIYKGTYEGWYDENQEEYLTETLAKDQKYLSAVTARPLVRRKEPCWFFKLGAYQSRIQEHFTQHPEFVRPEARRNEVLGRLRETLNDVPVSRPVTSDPATQFGIRVPGDEGHRIYVWIDALFNYLSVVDTDERRALWPTPHAERGGTQSTCTHFIAKDILWFHAVIWPAMLMALHESGSRFGFVGLPTTIYTHGYWVREGRKMSKSLGNFVTIEVLQTYAGKFSLDALRWYLLTQGPLGAQDADFSHAKFVEVYNTDLANGIGNCASRVANMIEKYFGGVVPAPSALHAHAGFDWPALCTAALAKTHAALAQQDVASASHVGIELVRSVDQYINATAPFKLAKTIANDPAANATLGAILYNCVEAVRIASHLLAPAMPDKISRLWKTWHCTPPTGATLTDLCMFAGKHALQPGQAIAKGDALFMRADASEAPPA